MSTNLCADSIPDLENAFNYCEPNFVFGEIEEIIVAPLETETGDPFPTDWQDEDAWDLLLAPSGSSPVAYKIPVRGTIDEPDRPEVDASKYRKAYPPKRYNLSSTADDLSDKAYAGLREMQNKRVRVWWISGGYLFGLEEGIEADVDTWLTIEEGEDSMHSYHLNLTWRSNESPNRVTSPFESTEATPTV